MKISNLLQMSAAFCIACAACKPPTFAGNSHVVPSHRAGDKGADGKLTSTANPSGSNLPTATNAQGGKNANSTAGNPTDAGTDNQAANTSATDPTATNGADGANASNSTASIPVTPTAEQLKVLCSDAAAVKQLAVTGQFPQPAASCAWGSDAVPFNGNIGKVEARIGARYEEAQSLGIPQGALLCKMTVSFFGANGNQAQAMYYDDEIFVLFDDLIIASSKEYGPRLASRNGFEVYDWSKLVATPYEHFGPGPYCIDGAASCKIPLTQTQGIMSLSVRDTTVQALAIASGIGYEGSTASQTNKTHSIGFVTIGDNDDPIDCKHSALGFSVQGEYIIPK